MLSHIQGIFKRRSSTKANADFTLLSIPIGWALTMMLTAVWGSGSIICRDIC